MLSLGMVDHTHPVSGRHLIRLLRRGKTMMTMAKSKAGSTPTLGRTRMNLSVKANASMTGRTDSVALLSSSFRDVTATMV